ncbi:hypothetical protein GMORB2_4654 [Geosmithia morbida]|uniref:Protamine P1 n=1 Tax=Geosmithia morbida TaxID=1094350 RepID=A0A9P5D2H9_9HYPO|nr:uncharacterized protein GMORB2_4654 [Geosmithia morbida]KAF4119524.1 hypothetical protein GMORB2_4654 [Geosmithia morbida]
MAPTSFWGRDTIYSEATCDPEDIFYEGSEDECYESNQVRKLRYEEAGRRFLSGQSPPLFSATLRGPFETEWTNPWKSNRRTGRDTAPPISKVTSPFKKLNRYESLKPERRDAAQCHLPSPESLKQVSVEQHPFLEDEEVARVQKWRSTVEPSEAGRDEFWEEAAQSPSSGRSPVLKKSTDRHNWLRRSPSKRKLGGKESGGTETPRKRRQQAIPPSSIRTPQESTRAFKNMACGSREFSIKNHPPLRSTALDQDEDELMDGPDTSFATQSSRLYPSAKRVSPKRAFRTANVQDSVDSEDELAHDKLADQKAAATLSSPVSDDGPVEEVQSDDSMDDDDETDANTTVNEDFDESAIPQIDSQQDDSSEPVSHENPVAGVPVERGVERPGKDIIGELAEAPRFDEPQACYERESSPLSSIESMSSVTGSEILLVVDDTSDAIYKHLPDESSELSSALSSDEEIGSIIGVDTAETETDGESSVGEESVQEATSHEALAVDDDSSDGSLTDASELQDALQGVDRQLMEESLIWNAVSSEGEEWHETSSSGDSSYLGPEPEPEQPQCAHDALTEEVQERDEDAALEAERLDDDEPDTPASYVDAQSTLEEQQGEVPEQAPASVEEQERDATVESQSSYLSLKGIIQQLVPLVPWGNSPTKKDLVELPSAVAAVRNAIEPEGSVMPTDEALGDAKVAEVTEPTVDMAEQAFDHPKKAGTEVGDPSEAVHAAMSNVAFFGARGLDGEDATEASISNPPAQDLETPGHNPGTPGRNMHILLPAATMSSRPDPPPGPSDGENCGIVSNQEPLKLMPPSTPETLLLFKPFAAFMTPSPERHARKAQPSQGKRGIVSAVKTSTRSKATKRVSFAPLPGGEAHESGRVAQDEGTEMRRAVMSPPPNASVADLPTSENADFNGHFNAMARRAGETSALDNNSDNVPSQETEKSTSSLCPSSAPGDVALADDDDPPATSDKFGTTTFGEEDELDLTEQVFADLQGLLQPWDLEEELRQKRKDDGE